MNDTSDPFYTTLEPGAFQAVKPTGTPCDAQFPCDTGLSKGATIAMAVVITVVGLAVIGGFVSWWWFSRKKGTANY